jgi:hypothetical protein
MSDETNTPAEAPAPEPAAPAPSPAPASMASAMAEVQDLSAEVGRLKKTVRGHLVAIIVLAVLLACMAAFTILPRYLGFGFGFGRPQGFQPGQMRQFQQNQGNQQTQPQP